MCLLDKGSLCETFSNFQETRSTRNKGPLGCKVQAIVLFKARGHASLLYGSLFSTDGVTKLIFSLKGFQTLLIRFSEVCHIL